MSSTNSSGGNTQEQVSATASRKYKIGKVKQTPTVQRDPKTGQSYIQLRKSDDAVLYGVTHFLNHYKEEEKLGQGTFGSVYKGIHLETKRKVAMKRIITNVENDLFPITAQREITILRRLEHKNIIKLIEMVYDYPPNANNGEFEDSFNANHDRSRAHMSPKTSGSGGKHFYMILPYMVSDLSGILHNPRIQLTMSDIKNIMLQLLEGINYIHCMKYMHRDIKTANILIDHTGTVKLADFGLARLYYGPPPNLKYPGGAGSGAKYTSVVVTRWYRAPELVLGDKFYTTAVDMWGVGCVFAEFFEKKPILQGTTDIDQGHVIFKLMGSPSEEEWRLARYLPGSELTRTKYKSTLKSRFGGYMSEAGLKFLAKLLALDPYKRYTAMAAMKDPFFSEEPLPVEHLSLPCEESHESDIKRYKEEIHQNMSQRAPTAPRGHIVEVENNPYQYRKPEPRQLPLGPSKLVRNASMNDDSPGFAKTHNNLPNEAAGNSGTRDDYYRDTSRPNRWKPMSRPPKSERPQYSGPSRYNTNVEETQGHRDRQSADFRQLHRGGQNPDMKRLPQRPRNDMGGIPTGPAGSLPTSRYRGTESRFNPKQQHTSNNNYRSQDVPPPPASSVSHEGDGRNPRQATDYPRKYPQTSRYPRPAESSSFANHNSRPESQPQSAGSIAPSRYQSSGDYRGKPLDQRIQANPAPVSNETIGSGPSQGRYRKANDGTQESSGGNGENIAEFY